MEYLDFVNKIIVAEQTAKKIAREAQEQERALDTDLEREIARLREGYMERARRRVADVERVEAVATKEGLRQWDEKLAEAMSAVERAYAQNREDWIEAIFQRIVGGSP